MNETDKQTTRVNDRRRFDPEGNPRPDAEEQPAASGAGSPESAPGHLEEQAAQLRAELDAARRRVDELARAVQAGERDREDFKKRVSRERERMLEVEKGNVALSLLETVDELDLCLGAADDSPLAQGVRMIRDGIRARLGTLGVEQVPLVNGPYDPNLAEAVDMEVTCDPAEDGRVTREVRAAWKLGDRVIRAGRVKVARYVPPAQA
jgi:molecular chaperone GrpE